MGEEQPESAGISPDLREAVTRLLHDLNVGDKQALDKLMPIVYDQLRSLASRCLRSERPDHTLRATALVHEVYLKLIHADLAWQDRRHFYAVAAKVMRNILVDHAKSQKRVKRGGGAVKIPLDEAVMVGADLSPDVIEVDDALERLAALDQRKASLIELLFFGGLTYEEAANVLEISPATVHRELRLAKAWLYRDLSAASAG